MILKRERKVEGKSWLARKRRVDIFKTYMNMMSEKVLILLCEMYIALIYFSPFNCTYTHKFLPRRPAAAAAIK